VSAAHKYNRSLQRKGKTTRYVQFLVIFSWHCSQQTDNNGKMSQTATGTRRLVHLRQQSNSPRQKEEKGVMHKSCGADPFKTVYHINPVMFA
jgi:hypothetical protein